MQRAIPACLKAVLVYVIAASMMPLHRAHAVEADFLPAPLETSEAPVEDASAPAAAAPGPLEAPLPVTRVPDFKPSWISAMRFEPRGRATFVGNDNIYIQHENPVQDLIFTLSPGVILGLGDSAIREETFIALDYEASALHFLENDSADALEHRLQVNGLYRLPKLSIAVDGGYFDLTYPDRDLGQRVHTVTTREGLILRYELRKIATTFEFRSEETEYDLGVGFADRNVTAGLDLGWTERSRVGAAFRVGRVEVNDSPEQQYAQLLLRADLTGVGKLQFHASAGLEARDFGGTADESLTIVFSIAAEYRPFDGTLLGFEAYRRNNPSGRNSSESYLVSGIALRAKQRLFRRFSAGLFTAFEDYAYQEMVNAGQLTRRDQHIVFRPSVAYDLVAWCSAEVFWEYRRNPSTIERLDFTNNVAGLAVTITF